MKIFNRFKKWKTKTIQSGLVIGKYRVILESKYFEYINLDKTYSGVLKERIAEIKRLENEIRIYKQLLDSSQQINRNYGNNR